MCVSVCRGGVAALSPLPMKQGCGGFARAARAVCSRGDAMVEEKIFPTPTLESMRVCEHVW